MEIFDYGEKENCKKWLIVFGAFVMNLIILCPYRLSGLIYVHLIEAYQTDRELAAMPAFMYVLMTGVLGPITGFIGQKLGEERTTLLGFLLAATGFGGVFFANNIIVVIIFMGFVYGAGLTLGSHLMPNIIKKLFSKNFNTAYGIVRSGPCLGSVILTPFAVYLFDTYGTAGTFLIIAGLMLNGIPITMLLIMAKKKVKTSKKTRKKLLQETSKTNSLPYSKINNKIEDDISTKGSGAISQISASQISSTLKEKEFTMDNSFYDEKMKETTSLFNAESYKKNNNVFLSNTSRLFSSEENIELKKLEDNQVKNMPETSYIENKISNTNNTIDSKQSKKATLFSTGIDQTETSREDLSFVLNNDFTKVDPNQNIDLKQSRSLKQSQLSSNNDAECTSNNAYIPSQSKKPTFCSSMKILINPIFLVLALVYSLLAYILTMVWTTLIDYSRDKGISRENEVYILMFQPFFDFIGRVGIVWVVDRGYVGHTMFYMINCLVCGLSVLGIIMSSSFIMVITYAAMFALTTGSQLVIAPGMMIKFMEKEELIMAMSSINIFYVPLSFTALPIIGYFRNELKSYNGVYYFVVGICLVSCAITPLANRFSKARKRSKVKALPIEIVT